MTAQSPLDDLIADALAQPERDDSGFTDRVARQLPPRRGPWRFLLLAAAAAVGVLPTITAPPSATTLPAGVLAASLALAALVALVWLSTEEGAMPRAHS